MSSKEIRVPDIGGAKAVDVVEVLVKPGEVVAAGAPLISLESDKASMEVPSPFAGTILTVSVKVGQQIGEGDLIATIDAAASVAPPAPAAAPSAPAPTPAPAPASSAAVVATPAPSAPAPAPAVPRPVGNPSRTAAIDDPAHRPTTYATPEKPAHASPSIRKYARELGVDLKAVAASGRKGRITKEDVQSFVKAALSKPATASKGSALPEMPVIDFAKFGPIESKPLTRIQKISAQSLHRSWLHVPHVTQFDEADITDMEAFRKSQKDETAAKGYSLTPLVFLMKAVVACLKEFPKFNSSLDPSGEALIMKQYYHLGIAVDTPTGLVVPVVRDVDQKSLGALSLELKELSGRARDGKLKPTDIQGACFTISSLGGIGGTAFTPIVNAPEVAILGVSRSSMKPVWQDNAFVPRLMLPLSLSYDHRVIDGADAARFTTYLSKVLGDIRRLLL